MQGFDRLVLAAVAAICAASGGTAAEANANLGAAGILTNRNCPQDASLSCVIGPRIYTQFAGGMYGGFSASVDNMNGLGASASGSVSFSSSYLPTLRVGSFSGTATRTGASLGAFRTFTYTGDRAINLALDGKLDYVNSGDPIGAEMYREGTLQASVALVSAGYLSVYTSSTTAMEIISGPHLFPACGHTALGLATYSSSGDAAGAHTATLSLSSLCGGRLITLHPGDTFGIIATLQSLSNRGGFTDATHTFRVEYDLINTVFADTLAPVGEAFLADAINSTVPDAQTWSLMIVGFGLAGIAARRRRAIDRLPSR